MADKDEFVGNDWPGYTAAQPRHGHRWVDILRRERGQYARNDVAYLPVPCQHCENAPCIQASDGAITRRDDGIVMIDTVKAKGDKALVDSCPYGAIWWNEELEIGQKCIFCAHLIDDPKWTPHTTRCTHSCPTEAMATYFVEAGEMDEMIAAEGLEAYLPELGTKPHTLYKNLHRFTKNFITAGVLVDGDCYEGATVTLCADGTALASQTTNFFGEFKFDGLDDGDYAVEVDTGGKQHSVTITIAGESQNLGFIEL
jgi:Fe-S-cluster-containing dehydrogenase component